MGAHSMEATTNFEGYIRQLTDDQLEALLFAAAAEELARHDASKSARQGAQAAFPAKV